jgi:hypothetical protein
VQPKISAGSGVVGILLRPGGGIPASTTENPASRCGISMATRYAIQPPRDTPIR